MSVKRQAAMKNNAADVNNHFSSGSLVGYRFADSGVPRLISGGMGTPKLFVG